MPESASVIANQDGLGNNAVLVIEGDEHINIPAVRQPKPVIEYGAVMKGIDRRAVGDHGAVGMLDKSDLNAARFFEVSADHIERVCIVGQHFEIDVSVGPPAADRDIVR